MTWKKYHRLNDIYKFLDYLALTYPCYVSTQLIGKTYEGRELKVKKEFRIMNFRQHLKLT